MFEVQCLDSNGNTINYFTQYDIDQKIIIPIDSCNLPESNLPSSPSYAAPEVHFSNKKREESLVVRSTVVDEKTISAQVPNILLQEPYPLFVYVYMTDSENVSSQKTILRNEIPIRKRTKPSDYFYVENIDRITAEMIKEEIEAAVDETRQNAIDDINSKRDSAIEDINQTTTAAITEVDNQMDSDYNEGTITVGDNEYTGGFINIGNDIISDLNGIKEDSLVEYNATVDKANETQANIETSINTTMTENGLNVQPTDDGEGNVDIVILINKSSE